jgi:predicted Ser/Thr protein kinase
VVEAYLATLDSDSPKWFRDEYFDKIRRRLRKLTRSDTHVVNHAQRIARLRTAIERSDAEDKSDLLKDLP